MQMGITPLGFLKPVVAKKISDIEATLTSLYM